MIPSHTRHVPSEADVEAAYELWRATCGPAALAAALGRPLADMRLAFEAARYTGFTTPTIMRDALDFLGVRFRKLPSMRGAIRSLPGLAHIQFTGPWTAEGASARWAYKYTHWVAVAPGGLVFDINEPGRWIEVDDWKTRIAPDLASGYQRADGGHRLNCYLEVDEVR